MSATPLAQRLGAEFIGSAFLLATVIGSGIMGERLAGGNEALALLGNTLPTGAILVVLITMLGPVSGAHFNPAVTGVFWLRGDIGGRGGALYVLAQIAGALVGVVAAHAMFELPLWQAGVKIRNGPGQWLGEGIATFGLLLTILATLKARAAAVPMAVGLYIIAAYWFTASTSFANPAVTIARAFSDTFAGIRLGDAPAFIAAQLLGAVCGLLLARWLYAPRRHEARAPGDAEPLEQQ
ncbi:MAG TPA: MIP/aquaporin family protein [Burkholderiales bacterium]|nr:MIP/aquaporin family protein [Burkholderiales bacterium]